MPRTIPASGHPRAIFQHHAQHVKFLGSQGHAHADLFRSLPHHIRKDAIDTDAGQQKGQQRKDAKQRHGKALVGNGVGDGFFHVFRIVDDQRRIEFKHAAAKAGQIGVPAISAGAQKRQIPRPPRFSCLSGICAIGRYICACSAPGPVTIQPPLIHVADYADDLRVWNFIRIQKGWY